MALNVKINFENCYKIDTVASDLLLSKFKTILRSGESAELGIKISDNCHPYFPEIFNLAFGPVTKEGEIDDQARLCHQDHAKVFSTVLLAALNFLRKNKDKYIGIDGSTDARAYMYYRCIQSNFDYLDQFFEVYGINYYIRL